mgnify:CR=1 FL=1
MKAESTIQKEMQQLWRRKVFYDDLHGKAPGRSWQEDQFYGACMALKWVLSTSERFSSYCPEYDEHGGAERLNRENVKEKE